LCLIFFFLFFFSFDLKESLKTFLIYKINNLEFYDKKYWFLSLTN